MPNRLIHESSPYLQQHAHNPVDWYAWGEEALRRAKEEDKPILLSIGYSACHWCHVMERESFENGETARIMNAYFVNIKVDREERPDLDAIYMKAVQSMTGQGGWPLTVFLTSDQKPFFGGTYFPPQDRNGMAGFPRVLEAVAQAYRERRADVENAADTVTETVRKNLEVDQGLLTPLTPEVLDQAFAGIAAQADAEEGGLGQAPKFPQPILWEFLLRYAHRTGERLPQHLTELTLTKMAQGGIFDQLGGGFHRYSTDSAWLVPHFEKMLYDNALLSRLYLHAYQVTGRPLFQRVAQQTLDYVLREMTGPDGEFYSAQDADSEGEEGKYYVWGYDELAGLLSDEERAPFFRYYGVTPEGNFEGKNILHVAHEAADVAQEFGLTFTRLEELLARAKTRLLEVQRGRISLAVDDKALTAWNALMLRSFAEGARTLNRDDYLWAAERNAVFVLEHLRLDGRLLRTYRDKQARLKGYLEDYAFLIDGLLSLYEAGWQRRWLNEAKVLADAMLELFWDEEHHLFYDTGRDHEGLLLRPRELIDNIIPSGNAMATSVLLRLAVFTGEERYRGTAVAALRSMRQLLGRHPTAFGQWLCALDFYLSSPKEIAIVGPREEAATRALVSEVYAHFLPNKVVAGYDPADEGAASNLPLLEDRAMVDGKPTAYVCQNYACQLPVTTPEALAQQLGEVPTQ